MAEHDHEHADDCVEMYPPAGASITCLTCKRPVRSVHLDRFSDHGHATPCGHCVSLPEMYRMIEQGKGSRPSTFQPPV